MKPTWERGNVRLYLGDCREMLASMSDASIDLIATDPPFGIGRDGSDYSTGSHGGRKAYEFKGWDSKRPDRELFRELFRVSVDQCIWGGNYFSEYLPPRMRWLVWDKGQDICGSDCELAFTSQDKALRRKVLNRVAIATDGAEHPTQKPVEIMVWSIGFFQTARTVCDPYMGSGTTGVAAVQTGRSFVGIEIDPTYFEIAVRRIDKAIDAGALFAPVPPAVREVGLFDAAGDTK